VRAIRRIANRTSHSGSTTSEEEELEGGDTKLTHTASGNKKRKADGLAGISHLLTAAEHPSLVSISVCRPDSVCVCGGGSSPGDHGRERRAVRGHR
jgi:hypothetical protein